MRTLLIYVSPSMYSHELTLHKHYTSLSEGDSSVIDDYISQYKAHWVEKNVGKVVIVVVDIGESGTHIHFSEVLLHPLKEKIIINKPSSSKEARRPSAASILDALNVAQPTFFLSPSASPQGDSEFVGTNSLHAL